jgi:hypothetical protein
VALHAVNSAMLSVHQPSLAWHEHPTASLLKTGFALFCILAQFRHVAASSFVIQVDIRTNSCIFFDVDQETSSCHARFW